jgi:hypothetical protein
MKPESAATKGYKYSTGLVIESSISKNAESPTKHSVSSALTLLRNKISDFARLHHHSDAGHMTDAAGVEAEPMPRRRGRPKKLSGTPNSVIESRSEKRRRLHDDSPSEAQLQTRKRGRPRKHVQETGAVNGAAALEESKPSASRGRGRPRNLPAVGLGHDHSDKIREVFPEENIDRSVERIHDGMEKAVERIERIERTDGILNVHYKVYVYFIFILSLHSVY